MSADPIILKLDEYGHFRNPAYPDTWNVLPSDVHKLRRDDPEVGQATQSYQQFFRADLEDECQAVHGRGLFVDGEIGPATEWLIEQPRCGMPDFAQAEEANWPETCRMEITVSYLFETIDASIARVAWPLALESWYKRLRLRFLLRETFSRDTRIWATDGPLSGSVLAWSQLATNNCRARLEQRYNTRTNWNKEFLQSTIAHEVGHALGSGHIQSRQALMYPSITSIVTPQPLDVARMVNLGYEKRTDDDPPPPEPTPGLITGTLRGADGTDYLLYGIPKEG